MAAEMSAGGGGNRPVSSLQWLFCRMKLLAGEMTVKCHLASYYEKCHLMSANLLKLRESRNALLYRGVQSQYLPASLAK